MVWYSHLFQNFPQFIVIHTVKGFGIVNKAEIDVFLELPCFFHDSANVGNLISGSSPFSKTSLNIWEFTVHVLLKPGLENLKHYFTSMWDDCNCVVVWAFFGIAFLWIGMKTDLFQSCGQCWIFQICWHIECSTFTASSFRIWNSSTGIPSPLPALFIVMLSKAHLISHSRMSGSNWVTTPSWLSRSLKPFIYSSVHSCHLFLISFVSVTTSYCFVLYHAHPCTKCSFDISNFIELISCLPHSIFPLFLCIVSLRRLTYLSLLFCGIQLNAEHS